MKNNSNNNEYIKEHYKSLEEMITPSNFEKKKTHFLLSLRGTRKNVTWCYRDCRHNPDQHSYIQLSQKNPRKADSEKILNSF